MIDEHLDGDSRRLLSELWETPVGRRWLLKAGLASAAALTIPLYGRPAVAAAAQRVTKGVAPTDFQFALDPARGVSDLVLVANGATLSLTEHTTSSRTELRAKGGLWQVADLSALTHYVSGVQLPTHRGMLLSVHGSRGQDAVVVSQIWHAPPAATRALAQTAHRLTGLLGEVLASSQRLKALGIKPDQIRSAAEVAQLETVGDSYQTAIALTMCHPNIATVDPTATPITKSLLAQTPAVTSLGDHITRLQRAGKDFATLVPAVDRDGSPSQIKLGDTTTTFSTFRLNPQSDSGLTEATKASLAAGVTAVRDAPELGTVIDQPLDEDPSAATKTWVQPAGVAPQVTPYAQARRGAGVDIKVKNPGDLFGTMTVVNGSYAKGKVPLKLYNNWVRWVWVYVQYLGKDGKNLSADVNANFPDTRYAKSLGLLPQVFTVLGVPLWDTNTIDVALDFPEGAHSARLLLCGLGSEISGGGWRQYFPDDAYPGRVAPTNEVLVPALITGILTIGLNVIALVTDVDIATVWSSIRKNITGDLFDMSAAFQAILDSTLPLTTAEALAAAVGSGSATYADVAANGADLSNLWNILLGLASVIPKVLFNPKAAQFFLKIGETLLADETATALKDAIPFVGEVIAVISAVGDAVTLAEVCGETISAPWVIENEVTLSYPAVISVSRDPRSSTFPSTARSWRLEALIDGALSLDPIAGTINEGGKLRSDPLQLSVTAPFGGSQIQWSFVALDASGKQVGTGVSAQFPNDDPAKPAAAVPISITQLPATITAATVFKRASTTAYDTAAGGYTWSDQVTVNGTVATKDIQDITGTAVATLAGVAGVVFKQGDHYYLRGVPLAGGAATIKLGTAPKEGYARRPFLLLDAFVDKADQGNHVLVEPDETTDAYHVRKVSLDPATGALSWDPNVSHGTFPLPVSAAALHSSGRVVALNTDNGRIGLLQPVVTERPQLAAYTAGPGTRVGLLSSPVAIAVTNPGVVLVLEAGASQLAAFDLNGNPVRYFTGQTAELQFTRPLASSGTALDLAVDGADQIYVLYYAGTGSTPADYHVDVYTKSGDVLDTHSPGVNVAHLAIDYWRSIYGANYDALTDLGTAAPRIDPRLGVAEPSLSRFDPIEPA